MSPDTLLLPTYTQMLKALSAWLDKARDQKGDEVEALLVARLAPDMFPLATQIRFACRQAHEGVYRLRGENFPPSIDILLDEGRNADTHPGTIGEAQARIAEAIALVEAAGTDAFDRDPQRPVAHALPNGMIFDLTAGQYVRDWTLPQFYFHLMAAYAILRHAGVDLGKADYVSHMFAHLRPGTMPA